MCGSKLIYGDCKNYDMRFQINQLIW
uniref:Uncharacterized protein n=1 Tax=Rhizophora mucronata TaxID=61149 RepID=A0A2P2Q9R5_RHIMU